MSLTSNNPTVVRNLTHGKNQQRNGQASPLAIKELQTQVMQMLVSPQLKQHLRYVNMKDKVLNEQQISMIASNFENSYKPAIAKSKTSREAFALQMANHLANQYKITVTNFVASSILLALKCELQNLL